jgi:hypothetical protein
MKLHHGHITHELDDQWWEEAGMVGFVPARSSFRPNPSAFPGWGILEIPITDVQPVERQLSHGVFNDGPSTSARERVVSILKGIREDAAFLPVELERLPAGGPYRFKLYHGAHRLYCAVAAGFSAVPAIDVTDGGPSVVLDFDAPNAS